MRIKFTIFSILLTIFGIGSVLRAETRYVGGDISLLPDYETAGSVYLDGNGKPISDVLTFCYDEGMNIMRVRLFVNPDDYTGSNKDANAKQDLDYILPLCKRIKDDGFALMLDFHYSDTWADPAAQWTPKAWEGLTNLELYQKIYDYTKETLETLQAAGVTPDFIQPGNEISYGMLWGPYGTNNPLKVYSGSDTNWSRFLTLLRKAIEACREVCPDAGIVLHTERVANVGVLTNFYNQVNKLDYDIIGLSYYPYFHGKMTVLDNALTTLENQFPEKQIMIVETGYSYAWEVPGTNQNVDYPYSSAGQNQFAQELVATLLKHKNCTGLLWWWMEYNAYKTSLSGWYNAPLFDSRNGRVLPALKTICSFGTGHSDAAIYEVEAEYPSNDDLWFDLQGRPIPSPTHPGYFIHNRKVVIK